MIILFSVLTVSIIAVFVEIVFVPAGNTVIIKVDNEIYGKYSLNRNIKLNVQSKYGNNEVIIEDGAVYVADSDCKNKICVKSLPISAAGQSIICLPHKLIISITGNESDLDAYTD